MYHLHACSTPSCLCGGVEYAHACTDDAALVLDNWVTCVNIKIFSTFYLSIELIGGLLTVDREFEACAYMYVSRKGHLCVYLHNPQVVCPFVLVRG